MEATRVESPKMLEVLYRIYEIPTDEQREENKRIDLELGFYSSTSKRENNLLEEDVCLCDTRDHFKDIMRDRFGANLAFRYSKSLKTGEVYCVIIGEHCYNTERYFMHVSFDCDCCGAHVETCYYKPIYFSDYEVRNDFFGISDYQEKRFCSAKCKQVFKERERARLRPDDDQEFFIRRDMFSDNCAGYIYKITKKSTGQFYIGQTMYAPVFRWGQHLKTERFDIANILDYTFETIAIVPKGENILEVEKRYIQAYYDESPELSLNIACTKHTEEEKTEESQ